jgi:hypothetical protein
MDNWMMSTEINGGSQCFEPAEQRVVSDIASKNQHACAASKKAIETNFAMDLRCTAQLPLVQF